MFCNCDVVYSQVSNGASGVPQPQKRLLSVLVAPKVAGAGNMASLKVIDGALVGRRYESSAAAAVSSDTLSAEKFEYQAEVKINLCNIVQKKFSSYQCCDVNNVGVFLLFAGRSTGSWI
jgi:heat shock protein 90kDa beta